MSILQFLLTFLSLTVISSGAIVGWYICTRGNWYISPDGKWLKEGMIFKEWSLFFEQYQKTKIVPCLVGGLKEKYDLLSKTHPGIAKKFTLQEYSLKMKDGNISGDEVKIIEETLLCKASWRKDELSLSVEEPVYLWPEWIQKPISSCPPCMASPYGTAIWLAFLKLQRDAFAWTDSPIFAKIAFCIIFLLTLACMNKAISKKVKL